MTPDEQEALSRQYSTDTAMLLCLISGMYAVFQWSNNHSRLVAICSWEKAQEYVDNPPRTILVRQATLEDLDL